MSANPPDSPEITIQTLRALKRRGEKFACLTAYDASFAAVLEAGGVEVLLVGDSLGMVVQGHATTLPVSLADMVYHTRCVARARRRALIMTDMPYMSASSSARALGNAARLLQEGGAHMVKIEGGRIIEETVAQLSRHSIPVCAHLGLLPQSVHTIWSNRPCRSTTFWAPAAWCSLSTFWVMIPVSTPARSRSAAA